MPVDQITFVEQRQALRQELMVQRQLIAQQLDLQTDARNYPRSMTMRFLTGRSVVGAALFRSGATFLATSAVKSLAIPIIVSLFTKRKRR